LVPSIGDDLLARVSFMTARSEKEESWSLVTGHWVRSGTPPPPLLTRPHETSFCTLERHVPSRLEDGVQPASSLRVWCGRKAVQAVLPCEKKGLRYVRSRYRVGRAHQMLVWACTYASPLGLDQLQGMASAVLVQKRQQMVGGAARKQRQPRSIAGPRRAQQSPAEPRSAQRKKPRVLASIERQKQQEFWVAPGC
jgi:hypothetical protein